MSHKALGIPVLFRPSTVINIPQKNIKSEYETCYKRREKNVKYLNSTSTFSIPRRRQRKRERSCLNLF